jgi:integrase/recombinase XerD
MVSSPYWARVESPLEAYVDGFRDELHRLGYTPLTAAGHVRLMAHLSRWLAREGLPASALTASTVEAYFAQRRAAGYVNERTPRALAPLVTYLQGLGVVAQDPPAAPSGPVEVVLARFRDYLLIERGLAATTAVLNVRLVRPFLADRVRADGQLDLAGLQAGEVAAFVLTQSRRWPRSAKRIVTAVRSLLRFAHVTGLIDQPLAAGVPSPAGWTLTSLPKGLDPAQVTALLAGCDRNTATGRRDFAILTVLVRFGLRAGEVATLTFADIDWRHGELVVRGKGHREDRLPLPTDVGQAIVDYLQHARPATAQGRTVFVRAQAPYRALTSHGVITVVGIASRRAGLGPIAAHRLRHTAATSMLHAGGSLAEIGQVLRHRRMLTTALYAKVDIPRLRVLARPWPTPWPGDAA